MGVRLLLCVALLGVASLISAQPANHAWRDSSPHQVKFVSVAPDVEVEVLDWGGKGDALVFLVGALASAHTFDNFAPRFVAEFHVYGITRRGQGASSRPKMKADINLLSRDVVAVLDALEIKRATLVGHSFAGDELTRLAADYPNRVSRLVYLDAAYDRPAVHKAVTSLHIQRPSPEAMPAEASRSPAAFAAYSSRTMGVDFPEGEILRCFDLDQNGVPASLKADWAGEFFDEQSPEYSRVKTPALAIYAVPRSPADAFPSYDRENAAFRKYADRYFREINERYDPAEREKFRRGVAQSCVVEFPGAKHIVYLSNPDDTEKAMRSFFNGNCLGQRGRDAPAIRPGRH